MSRGVCSQTAKKYINILEAESRQLVEKYIGEQGNWSYEVLCQEKIEMARICVMDGGQRIAKQVLKWQIEYFCWGLG